MSDMWYFLLGNWRFCIICNLIKNLRWFACSTWKSNLRCTTLNKKRGKLGSLFSYLEGYGVFFSIFIPYWCFTILQYIHLCLFRYISQWLKTNYQTPNVCWSLLLSLLFEKRKSQAVSSLFFTLWQQQQKYSC